MMTGPDTRKLASTKIESRSGDPLMLRELFIGKTGLRVGWSAVLFVALYQGTEAATTSTLRHFISFKPEGPINLLLALSRESCELFSVLLATWTMSRIEGRSLL